MQGNSIILRINYFITLFAFVLSCLGCQIQESHKDYIANRYLNKDSLVGVHFKIEYPMSRYKMEKFIPAHYREEHFAEDLAKVVITNDSSVNVYIRHSINPPYLLPLKSLDYIDSKLIRSRGPACSNGNFTTCLKVGDSLVQFFPIDFYKKTEKISFTFCYFNDSSLLLKKEKKVTCLVKDRIIRVIEP